jgi:putative membrane protein
MGEQYADADVSRMLLRWVGGGRRCDDHGVSDSERTMNSAPLPTRPALALTSGASLAALAWSAVQAFDPATWFMEVAPVLIVLPLLWATRRSFPLTPLLYALIALHAIVLCVGGHYTYARVPVGFWVQEWFDLGRNHYDRLGHLMQGCVPAIAARELLLRTTPLRAGRWMFTLVTLSCLGISALYELIEFGAAMGLGQGADEFLGTQGDPWDTQKDMLMAWIGAMLAQFVLARWHNAQLARLPVTKP